MEIIAPPPPPPNSKSPEPEPETPTRIHQSAAHANPNPKPVSFSNGVLKRHHPPPQHHPVAVVYKECLKNHVASLGGHALDGCGEFMPSPAATADDPTSIKCAACGCHRNFHRREPDDPPISPATHHNTAAPAPPHHSRKRFRTKFTQEQKEKMHEFADKVGWKMQKHDDEMVMEFCNEVGVDRGVLKVWMHNNKNTLGKKDNNNNVNGSALVITNGLPVDNVSVTVRPVHVHDHHRDHEHPEINGNGNDNLGSQDGNQYENDSGTNGGGTNGSSSSS
uniref:ZF-HD homeobox protein At4g24660 family n=1 Tax=Cajanus cajan TaxID=3821 RepID=A0A151QQE8_CAJCA|nr:ZF-HD homeobox protein At4g24660 family [Cajanus cajan]